MQLLVSSRISSIKDLGKDKMLRLPELGGGKLQLNDLDLAATMCLHWRMKIPGCGAIIQQNPLKKRNSEVCNLNAANWPS